MKSSRLLAEQLNLVTYKIILTSLSAHVLFDSKTPRKSPCSNIFK